LSLFDNTTLSDIILKIRTVNKDQSHLQVLLLSET